MKFEENAKTILDKRAVDGSNKNIDTLSSLEEIVVYCIEWLNIELLHRKYISVQCCQIERFGVQLAYFFQRFDRKFGVGAKNKKRLIRLLFTYVVISNWF